MPRAFGQLDRTRMATSASRIIFSSGEYDPWRAQSLNASLSPTLQYVMVPQGAHHSDLGGPYNPLPEAATAGLAQVRQFEIDTLNLWLTEWRAEHEAARRWAATHN